MTISSQTRKAGPFTGNGVTTAFPFAFKVFTASDLLVVRANLSGIETNLVLGTDYAVTLNADQNSNPGGTVTLTGALASGFLLSITSQVPLTQSTDLTNQGGFYPAVINSSLDKLTILTQQLNEQVLRAAKVPITSAADPADLVANIDLVADSLPAVTTVATNIAAVNTNATNIVAIQNAASNALAAASSASSAAASAAAAASSYDSFDDRYLGAKPSDPTLDNDGNPLIAGALYYNTTAQVMKVYDAAVWLVATSALQAALTTYEYVAAAGQTTFLGPDSNALNLTYIPGGLIVTHNGLILRPGDEYVATSGSSIVLVTAASVGDEVCAYAFSSFNVANVYTQAQVDVLLAAKLGASAGAVGTINLADGAVTLPKMANVATASLLGRNTAGTGTPEVLTAIPSAIPATTQAVKTSDSTIATTAFVDRLRSLLTATTGSGGGTAVIGDRGCLLSVTAGVTIPAGVFAANDTFAVYNNSSAPITITQGAGLTLRQAGTANTGNRTLVQRGLVSVVFISATEAVISGGGLA